MVLDCVLQTLLVTWPQIVNNKVNCHLCVTGSLHLLQALAVKWENLTLFSGAMAQVTGRGSVLGVVFLFWGESRPHRGLNSES